MIQGRSPSARHFQQNWNVLNRGHESLKTLFPTNIHFNFAQKYNKYYG